MTTTPNEPIEVVCLCEGEWRICDGRLPASDSRRLISYVEETADDVEVLWLPSLSVQRLPSLEEAVLAAKEFCSKNSVPQTAAPDGRSYE